MNDSAFSHSSHATSVAILLGLLVGACAPAAMREAPTGDRVAIVVRNDAEKDIVAFLVRDRAAAITLGPVESKQTRTFRLSRVGLEWTWLELHAYARSLHMTALGVTEAANQDGMLRPLRAAPAYTSRPFHVASVLEVLWKLDRFTPLSSLSTR